MIYFNILALTFEVNLHRQMMINRTKTYDNFLRPEISDFASVLHAITLTIFYIIWKCTPKLKLFYHLEISFYTFIQSFAKYIKHPTKKTQNDKLHKAIKPRLCEPTKLAIDTRRWRCSVILPSDGLYIKCAYGSLLQLRNITP